MRAYLPFLVVGLATGSIYALAAMGLVITYTTSGVFNFAHGAVGMAAAYLFYSLRQEAQWPTVLAFAAVVLVAAPLFGALLERLLLRRLSQAGGTATIVVSLGLLVALQGAVSKIYGAAPKRFAPLFPDESFRLPGVFVGYGQAMVVGIVAVVAIGVSTFLHRSHVGVQTRAVVTNIDLAGLAGTNARRITTLSWMIGSSFAALSAILLAPIIGLDAIVLTLLVVQAFGAAVIGRLTSLPGAYLGGLAVGLATSLSTKVVAGHPLLAGLPTSVPFIILFAVLVIGGRGAFIERAGRLVAGTPVRQPLRRELTRGAAVLGAVGLLPLFVSETRLFTATATLIYVLIFASLGLLVGVGRLPSLCHAVFVALGATTMANLLESRVPYALALLLSGLLVTPVAALVALPSLRLSGLFLGLATFGFGILAQALLFPLDIGFGGRGLISLRRPELFGISFSTDTGFFFLVLGVVALGLGSITVLRATTLGRLLQALADSRQGVESLGVSGVTSRVTVFCVSAGLAGICGGLLGSLLGSLSSLGFDSFQSLVWIAVLTTGGASSIPGAALAAVLFVALPTVWSANDPDLQAVFFGIGAMLLAQTPNGLVGLVSGIDLRRWVDASAWRIARSPLAARLRSAA